MAKAEKVQVQVMTSTDGISLTLSVEEAKTLLAVVGVISGSPEFSRRKHTESIYKALRGLMAYGDIDLTKRRGGISFGDEMEIK